MRAYVKTCWMVRISLILDFHDLYWQHGSRVQYIGSAVRMAVKYFRLHVTFSLEMHFLSLDSP